MVRRLVIFVLIMVVLTGCVNGPVGSNATDSQHTPKTPNGTIQTESPSSQTNDVNNSTPESPESPTDTTTTDTESSQASNDSPNVSEKPSTPASTDTNTVSSKNPWGERTLTVAIDNKLNNDRQFRPLVADALAYWEQNSKQYAGYSIEYTLKPNAKNPDVVVSFDSSIEDCKGTSRVAGCAPYITSSGDVSRPVEVQIKGGYTDDSTTQLIIHELGHTLGLDHGDRPKRIMAAKSDLTELPQPDVTERALPWNHSTLTVAVDQSTVPRHKRKAVNKQINAALNYYDRGAAGTVPKRVSFKRVSNPTNADIHITFSGSLSCDIRSGSCSKARGINRDSDDALEQYIHVTIGLTDIDTDTVGWHVGNRIGADVFGFDHPADFPRPLRGHSPLETRKSRWWN